MLDCGYAGLFLHVNLSAKLLGAICMNRPSFFSLLTFVVMSGLLATGCVPITTDASTAPVDAAPAVTQTTIDLPVVNALVETQNIFDIEAGMPITTPTAARITDAARIGDADDPAIWVHPSDPALSLVIGALKDGGLDVYDLDGQTIQSINPAGVRYNNIDLTYNFALEGEVVDLAVATDRYGDKLAFFTIDPATRQLTDVSDPANRLLFTPAGQTSDQETTAYGITLYHSAQNNGLYAFVTRRATSEIGQFEIVDNGNGLLGANLVRTISLPVPAVAFDPQTEGMVADQELGFVYIAQEDVGIWKFGAEPDANDEGVLIHPVAPVGETLVADAEGLTIYYAGHGQGYLIASSQGDNRFSVYTRAGDNQYLGSFFVGVDSVEGDSEAIDGSQGSDGAQVISVALGERFPNGLFVVHDGNNEPVLMLDDEGELENVNTNFKFVPWELIANAFTTPLTIDSTSYNPRTPAPMLTGSVSAIFTLPDLALADVQNAVLPASITNDRQVLLGGVGSDLWRSANDAAGEFWMVTDRGPNGLIVVDEKNRRTFPVPEFTPLILQVQAEGDALRILQTIPVLTQSGEPVTGLPNIDGHSETGWDVTAQRQLPFNPNGMDTEGIVRTATGDFWLVEEYAPSLIHVDATGHVIKRFVPAGLDYTGTDYPVAATLPSILSLRTNNRGFEGLALSPDEQTIYIVLQSPLKNPDPATGELSTNTRVLAFDVATEQVVGEYIYCFDDPARYGAPGAPGEMKLSGVIALSPTTLLILERTDAVAKLYTVDLSKATNVVGSAWDEPAAAATLETWATPAANKVKPLPKTLLLDLAQLPETPPKIEGVAIIDAETIAIVNDNDFNLGEFDANGNNSNPPGAQSHLLTIRLSQPLDSQ